jgi:hypothetical protein
MQKSPAQDNETTLVKFFGLFLQILGCLFLFILCFYYPLLSSLGWLSVLLASSIGVFILIYLGTMGFKNASQLSSHENSSYYELLATCITSLFCYALALLLFIRVTTWSIKYFLNIDLIMSIKY